MVTTGSAKRKNWMTWVLSGLPIVFLLFDAGIKFVRPAPVVEAFARLGWPVTTAAPLGALLLLCTVLYSIPRTAVLGAIFLTGYLGGAISAHVRVGDPLFSHVLFPTYLGAMIWGGLYLREARLRSVVPLRKLA